MGHLYLLFLLVSLSNKANNDLHTDIIKNTPEINFSFDEKRFSLQRKMSKAIKRETYMSGISLGYKIGTL